MRIVVGSDDSGETLDAVLAWLADHGHDVERLDIGRWPEVARELGEAVVAGRADQGVLMCWTGTGTAMMANKVPGVRAALCWDPWIAEGARRWNDANVLVLSLKRVAPEDVPAILDAWFAVAEPDPDEADNIARLVEYERARG